MLNQFNVSLWGDEAFSAILSMKPIPEIIRIIARDTSPPFFNIIEHFWFGLFGSSEVSIRLLVFIFSLIAVFFTYKTGSYFWNRRTGALAAVLTFLNPFFFIYAFEGRMYSLLAATVSASMYFFVRKNWVGYVISTTAALYSHHFAIFAVFVQGLWFLKEFFFGRRGVAISILKSFFAIGILYSFWIVPLYNQTKMVGGGFWLGKPSLTDLFGIFAKYLAYGISHPLAGPSLVAIIALLVTRKWSKDLEKSLFLALWFIAPILLTWVVSLKFQSIFFDRYLLYTIPATMLLAASHGRRLSRILIPFALVLFLIIDWNYFTHPAKRPFRDLANYVKEAGHGDDYLINWNAASHHLWESKYYGLTAPLYVPEGARLPFYVGTALMREGDIVSTIPTTLGEGRSRTRVQRVGAITSGSIEEVEIPSYTKLDSRTFGDLKFIWFRKSQ